MLSLMFRQFCSPHSLLIDGLLAALVGALYSSVLVLLHKLRLVTPERLFLRILGFLRRVL